MGAVASSSIAAIVSWGHSLWSLRRSTPVPENLEDEIEVKLPGSSILTDGDIAAAALHLLDWSTTIPHGSVQITVSDGRMVVERTVDDWYQRNDLESALCRLKGVQCLASTMTSCSGASARFAASPT
jgi:hypothetical protein